MHSNPPFISQYSIDQYSEWLKALDVFNDTLPSSENIKAILKSLKSIRNKIIGSPECKKLFATQDLFKKFAVIISTKMSEVGLRDCQKECAIIIGSLAFEGVPEVNKLIENILLRPLLDLFLRCAREEPDFSLLEAIARTARTIFRFQRAPKDLPFEKQYLDIFHDLLLKSVDGLHADQRLINIGQYSAIILANCCDSKAKQIQLCERNFPRIIVDLLDQDVPRLSETALDLLAAVARDNQEVSSTLIWLKMKNGALLVQHLFEIVESHQSKEMRLLGCICLTNLCRAKAISDEDPNVSKILVSALALLLDEPGIIRCRAPIVLAYLVSHNEALQLSTIGCNAIGRLAKMLKSATELEQKAIQEYGSLKHDSTLPQYREGALLALAAICSTKDECRKLVLETTILPIIIRSMSDEHPAIRSAACQCSRSLSRSVKNLRTSLVDAGILQPLLKLLQDDDLNVKITACATICNIVLDFSPMKKAVIDSESLDTIIGMARFSNPALRLNAVWAIKNLLYLADQVTKSKIMDSMGFDLLFQLTQDVEVDVQVQALNLIRNLSCGEEQDIILMLQGLGAKRLLDMVMDKLESRTKEIILQALYIVVNMATGGPIPKGAIMVQPRLLQKIREIIESTETLEDVKIAAIWCVINLTWPEDDESLRRVQALKQLNFEGVLDRLASGNYSIDLKDRAAIALEHFSMSHY